MSTFWKYTIAVLAAVGAGIVAYATVHPEPPTTGADFWKLFVVTLTSAGIGAGGKAATNAIDSKITK